MLESSKSTVRNERLSRKEPLDDKDARALLAKVDTVVVARGRKVETLKSSAAKVAQLKGPTGNYRAPMLQRGKTLLVGFNAEALERLLK